jgi:hypothetical protein
MKKKKHKKPTNSLKYIQCKRREEALKNGDQKSWTKGTYSMKSKKLYTRKKKHKGNY